MKNNHTPDIRFAGFTKDWEQRELGELAKVRTGKAFSSADFKDDGEYLVITNKNIQDETNGVTSVGDRIDISEDTILNNYLLSGDNILVTMDGVNIGKTGKYSNEKAVLAQRVGRLNSEQLEFVYQITSSNKFISEMNKLSVGNAIKHISLKQISDYSFSAPTNEEEQEKIGIFFKQLDKVIALHKQELNTLKQTKLGFLQKMFPKEGGSVPEVRFPGYTGDWEQRKLGDITESYSGGTPSVEKKSYYGGSIPFIRSAEINSDRTELFITEKGLNHSSAKMVDTGDILYALYGATSGEVGISRIRGAINQAILVIKPKLGNDSYFITQWLKKQKSTIINTYLQGGQGNLSGSIIRDLSLSLPSDKCEQKQIGNFFKQLDEIIAFHQSELDTLKETKKAFLQKIFA